MADRFRCGRCCRIWVGRANRLSPREQEIVDAQQEFQRTLARYVEKAKPDVERALQNASSPRFAKGSIGVTDLEDGKSLWVVCGYVDAKDETGVYTGNRPWYMFILWDGTSSVCVNSLTGCKYPVRGGPQAAESCRRSLEY